MVSSPLKAATSMNSVERGRWKLVISTIDRLEPVAGRDEDRGFAGERPDRAVLGRRRLQQPQRRGADGDDAPAGGARAIEGGGRLGGDLAPLGVHAVFGDVLGLDRQEGAGADVQGDEWREMPRASSAASSAGVKCRPAVGAATAPSWRA